MEDHLLHHDLTRKIIGCGIAVFKELGTGYSEQVYHKAFKKELNAAGLQFLSEVPMEYSYKGEVLGYNRLDILVENLVIVELKVGKFFQQAHLNQILNYLNCSSYNLGLLLLFSPIGLKFRRVINENKKFKLP